ncbi:MAG: bifunctional isocitrate dehydrogenase kinase/phosphatase, partial [Limnohabitans sp.]|nr:bifunctional isocitrate dehydrogenase kinase/phosphatase [Limnohabitans sp.]
MLPSLLDSPVAYDIAKAMLSGFNRHYQFFRAESARAKHRFETQDWRAQQSAQKERIAFYDLRVDECRSRLSKEFNAQMLELNVWQQAKLHYIGMLVDHHQSELAETFFNSIVTKLIDRSYFKNEFIFLRPAVSTEYIENSEAQTKPTYRAWYPTEENLKDTLKDLISSFGLRSEFEDLERDAHAVANAIEAKLRNINTQVNFQLHALLSLFFRNKGAYLVRKLINGFQEFGFSLPILYTEHNQLMMNAALFGEVDLLILFSFSRDYFMIDMEMPSAHVRFLSGMMPHKPQGELYNALGLAKQGKDLFYRDFLSHLHHSTDRFRISPGIKGMVILVFDLPSFPYVFKAIKDFYPPPKETTREQIKAKYLLVKQHDRVGRMAETFEYSHVAFLTDCFDPELIDEIQHHAPSPIEILY